MTKTFETIDTKWIKTNINKFIKKKVVVIT